MKNIKLIVIIIISVYLFFTFPNAIVAKEINSNEILFSMLESTELDKVDFLQKINITENEYDIIEEFTLDLIKYCTSDTEKMDTIFKWVNTNIKYANSNNDPYQVFINKKAICQGYSNLYSVMMKVANIPTIILEGDTYFGAHAWCLSLIDNKWILADPTNNVKLYDIKDYDTNYTKSYYLPYFINVDLFEDDDYIYSYYNGVAVVKTKNNTKVLDIPEKIKDLDITTFCISAINEGTTEVNFGKNINNVEFNSNGAYTLEAINVKEENDVYSSFSGVLYSKDFSSIIYIPRGITKVELKPFKTLSKNTIYGLEKLSEIVIDEGTEEIDSYAFEAISNLEKVYIPKSVSNIKKDAFYNCGKYTLYVYKGSYGYEFAKDNNIPYVIIDEQIIKGDINKDGKVNAIDASIVLDKFNYDNINKEDLDIADMNNDGKLNAQDSSYILDIYNSNNMIENFM